MLLPSADALRSGLAELAYAVQRSRAVTKGLYIQPEPRKDQHWVDLTKACAGLDRERVVSTCRDFVKACVATYRAAPKQWRVLNVCNPKTSLSDNRFSLLHDFDPDDVNVDNVVYTASGDWEIPGHNVDNIVLCALPNAAHAYRLLFDQVRSHTGLCILVPIFGRPRWRTESAHSSNDYDVDVIPMLCWDGSKYVSLFDAPSFRNQSCLIERTLRLSAPPHDPTAGVREVG